MSSDPIVVASAARTPMGGFQGDLASKPAPDLGAAAIREAVARAGLASDDVDEAYVGCVLPAGVGQAPARQAVLGAGLPISVPCTTVGKVCGSGMKALMLGHDTIFAGNAAIVVAGGMESMSNAPYLLDRARAGYRLGHGRVIDHMFFDGLEDAYAKGRLMGTFAEDAAAHFGFTRDDQDDYALASLDRSLKAISSGAFAGEVVPVVTKAATISIDEQPGKAKRDKIRMLKPAFRDGGTVTAANSSSISDGAAALTLMRMSQAEKRGLTPLAVVRGHTSHAAEPAWFTTAPVGAMEKLLGRVGWTTGDVDLWEVNEAFAVVALIAIRQMGLDPARVNVHGGACALGHPIGASGARIVVTLLAALKTHGLKRGVASLCIGGGEATAMAFELV